MNKTKKLKIHCIGIGGIGISGLAKFLYFNGHSVTGSDTKTTSITKELEQIGIKINIPHSETVINNNIDLIIYSAIIKNSNIEIIQAIKLGIKTLSRNEALPFILKDKKVFSVCGAHGKSTTTSILSSIFYQDSAIIGAYSREFNSNVRFIKNSQNIIFEADESDGSFLNSNPYFAILTNAEPEHMEFYNYNLDKFHKAYIKFLEIAPHRVINGEDKFLKTLNISATRLFPSQDILNLESKLINGEPYINFNLKNIGSFRVWGFGQHIAIDSSLAILTALEYGLNLKEIQQNIRKYRGAKKRFEIIEKNRNYILIDDYGHHPTEIEATLKSLFLYKKLNKIKQVIAIWQPHKYSRTIDNMPHFQTCFKGVDRLIILPVWEAGEEKIDIDFKELFKEFNPILAKRVYKKDLALQIELINGDNFLITEGNIIGFGAGNITYQLRGEI